MDNFAFKFDAFLPFPPTANHRNRQGIVNGRIKVWNSEEYENFQALVRVAVNRALWGYSPVKDNGKDVYLSGALFSTITVFLPKKGRADLDNVPKAIHDALERAGLFANDRQIVRVLLRLSSVRIRRGGCRVLIHRISFEDFKGLYFYKNLESLPEELRGEAEESFLNPNKKKRGKK